jgi:hypothetical protein
MHYSIVRGNLVYNPEGFNVWGSPDNEIYNNTIRNVSTAFYLSNPSSSNIGVTIGNKVYKNNVDNVEFGVESFDTEDNEFFNIYTDGDPHDMIQYLINTLKTVSSRWLPSRSTEF